MRTLPPAGSNPSIGDSHTSMKKLGRTIVYFVRPSRSRCSTARFASCSGKSSSLLPLNDT
jgi:hypothetical protein